MKKIFVSFVSAVLIVFGMSSLSVVAAATCPFGGSPNWQGVCDTTTDSGQEYHGPTMTVEQAKTHTENNPPVNNPPVNNSSTSSTSSTSTTSTSTSSTSTSSTSTSSSSNNEQSNNSSSNNIEQNPVLQIVTSNPDIGHGYAAVDTNGNVLNVIVCSYNVCGKDNVWLNLAINQGIFPKGTRLLLQTLQDLETKNVAGYMDAQYNNHTNVFEINLPICSGEYPNTICNTDAIFEIPIAYPGSQELLCIRNCKMSNIN